MSSSSCDFSCFCVFKSRVGNTPSKGVTFLHTCKGTKTFGMSGKVHLRINLKMVLRLCSTTYWNYQNTTDSIDVTLSYFSKWYTAETIKNWSWWCLWDRKLNFLWWTVVLLVFSVWFWVWQREYSTEMAKAAWGESMTERWEKIQQRENDRAMQKQQGKGHGFFFSEMNINNMTGHNRTRDQRDHLHCHAISYWHQPLCWG